MAGLGLNTDRRTDWCQVRIGFWSLVIHIWLSEVHSQPGLKRLVFSLLSWGTTHGCACGSSAAFSATEQGLVSVALNNLMSSSSLMRVKLICKLTSSPPSLDLCLQKNFWEGCEAAGALLFCNDSFVQRMNSALRSLLPEAAVSKSLKLIRLSAKSMEVRARILTAMCVRSQLCTPGHASWPLLGAWTSAPRVFNIYVSNDPEGTQLGSEAGTSIKGLVLHLTHLSASHGPLIYSLRPHLLGTYLHLAWVLGMELDC